MRFFQPSLARAQGATERAILLFFLLLFYFILLVAAVKKPFSELFQPALAHIHRLVGTFKHIAEAFIRALSVFCHARRHNYLARAQIFVDFAIKSGQLSASIREILALNNNNKLVAAYAVNGTVTEKLAYHHARVVNIIIARVVPLGVVYIL